MTILPVTGIFTRWDGGNPAFLSSNNFVGLRIYSSVQLAPDMALTLAMLALFTVAFTADFETC